MSLWHGAAGLGVVVASFGLVAAALHDVAVRTVPNWLVASVAAGAMLTAVADQRAPASLVMAAGMLAACGLLWARGWLGGGDAKLLAAVAPLVAPAQAPDLLLSIALAGGLLALPYLPGRRLFARPAASRSRAPAALLRRLIRCEHWRLWRRGPLPYAVAIAAGAILVLVREG